MALDPEQTDTNKDQEKHFWSKTALVRLLLD